MKFNSFQTGILWKVNYKVPWTTSWTTKEPISFNLHILTTQITFQKHFKVLHTAVMLSLFNRSLLFLSGKNLIILFWNHPNLCAKTKTAVLKMSKPQRAESYSAETSELCFLWELQALQKWATDYNKTVHKSLMEKLSNVWMAFSWVWNSYSCLLLPAPPDFKEIPPCENLPDCSLA